LERGIGPKQGWRIYRVAGERYRARRAIVKARVVKLRNAKSSVWRGHLAYLQCAIIFNSAHISRLNNSNFLFKPVVS
jgi:hypothetical protein